MDSQEAANLAQIQNTQLSRWLVVLAVIQIGSPFVFYWLTKPPDPSVAQSAGGFVMPTWLPVVFFASSFLVTTIALIIVASKRWRHKHLRSEVSALTTLVANLKKERQEAWDRANEAVKDASEANRIANHEKGQREITDNLFRDAEKQLADLSFLKQLAEEQAKDISQHVSVTLLEYEFCGSLQLTGTHLSILVGISVTNESVFEISVEPTDVSGRFGLANVPFRESASVFSDAYRPPIKGLKPKGSASLYLEQPLFPFEADKITRCLENPEADIWIGGVTVPMSANNPAIQVEPRPLKMATMSVPLKRLKSNTNNP